MLIEKKNKTTYPFNNFTKVIFLRTQIQGLALCGKFRRKQ